MLAPLLGAGLFAKAGVAAGAGEVAAIPPPRRSRILLLALVGGDPAGDPMPAKRPLTLAADGLDAAGGLEISEPPKRSASRSMLLGCALPDEVGAPVEI